MTDDQSYRPLIRIGGNPNPNIEWLQTEADRLGVTHAQDFRGDVRPIFSKLNRKSVPLNNAGVGPQRWAYTRVGSLGVLVATDEAADADAAGAS